jgi:heat shock protein HslJ
MNEMLKKGFIPTRIIFLSVLMILACVTGGASGRAAKSASSPESQSGNSSDTQQRSPDMTMGQSETRSGSFSDIQGKDWVLEEVRINSATVRINRPNNAEAFTIRFEDDRVGGIGFPNRYFGPYTAGEGNSLSIGNMVSTMMAPLFEIEGLREHEYYGYLSKVKSWAIRNGKLELTTAGANGEAVVLIYQ